MSVVTLQRDGTGAVVHRPLAGQTALVWAPPPASAPA
jgi:hypothetical protein